MQQFEYKIIPAPRRASKAKGVKTAEDRFAKTLTDMVNDHARDGWDYVRTDTLPVEERVGFTGKTTTFQHLMVFRRGLSQADATFDTPLAPQHVTPDLRIADAPPTVRLVDDSEVGPAPSLGPAAKNAGHAAE